MLVIFAPPQSRDGAFLRPKEGSMNLKTHERLCDVLMYVTAVLGALLVITCLSPASANTTPAATVTVPWGDWLSAGIEQIVIPILAAVLLALLAWAAKFLPASLRAYATTKNTAAVEQLLQKAISFALNKAALASAGQSISVPVGSATIANALSYAVAHGPQWLLDLAGGTTGIEQKIIARLPVTSAPPAVAPVPLPPINRAVD
jgi:hypothetical protein